MNREPRIDAYIAKARAFAQPILNLARERVHAACPDIEEAIKWGSPSFLYKGKILCSMAAFKEHATFGFWHGALVTGQKDLGAMGSFGRLTRPEDLPDESRMSVMIAKASALIDAGVRPPHVDGRGKHPRPEIGMLPAFRAALDGNAQAQRTYASFPPSQQREYLEWIVDAKREDTRVRRIEQAIAWLAEGKRRNWKYENC